MMASAATSDTEITPPEPKHPRTDGDIATVAEPQPQNAADPETESDGDDEWSMMLEDIYIQEHFGTTADEIVDIIFNTSLQHLTALLPSMRKALMVAALPDGSSSEESAVASAKIDAGLAKYVENFYTTLERNSDAMLLYLKHNIINIPENIVLPDDSVQIAYKELVQSLQAKKRICGDVNEPDYTEENTAELLADKAEKLREKLLEKKLEKLKLEHSITRANRILKRLNTAENSLDSAFSEVSGSVREYILKNIAAAFELPVGNGARLPNGAT